MGEYDGDYGTVLINKGNGNFSCSLWNGCIIKGEVRHIRKINAGKKESFILARNNDSLKVIRFR
jgi:enediyne biosynthesis protein E4